jgi:hypothetical protein
MGSSKETVLMVVCLGCRLKSKAPISQAALQLYMPELVHCSRLLQDASLMGVLKKYRKPPGK